MRHLNVLMWLASVVFVVMACESSDGGGGVGTQQTDTGSSTNPPLEDTGSQPTPDTSMFDTSQPQPDTNTGPECTFNLDLLVEDVCQGDQLCILDNGLGQPGHCEGAFGRLYTVAAVYAKVPERDENDECWDIGCGAPDLFMRIFLNGQVVLETTAVEDLFEVSSFVERGSALIAENATLEVALYDEDPVSDDVITNCQVDPLTANFLRSRVLSCGQDGGPQFLFLLILQ